MPVMRLSTNLLLAMLLGGFAAGCGTDSGSGDTAGGSPETSSMTQGVTVSGSSPAMVSGGESTFSLRLTDAAIDDAVKVVLQILEIELRKTSGGWVKFTLPAPLPVDLLKLQGTRTANLLQNVPVEPGDYNEIRLVLDGAPMANYIDLGGGGVRNLFVPSGSSSGLKIKGDFTVPATGLVDLIADFDLRQSVRANGLNYRMDPVVRLVEADSVGHIRGTVIPAMLTGTNCSDNDVDTYNAAYIFVGHNVTPDDIDQDGSSPEPLATASIAWDPLQGSYLFEAAFLPPGNYTVALTCNADGEDLDANDDLQFFDVRNATVIANNLLFL